MAENEQKLKVLLVSDSTGETARQMASAAMAQFTNHDVTFVRYKNVRNKEQINVIFTEASIHQDSMIICTIVSAELREYIAELSRTKHIRSVDLMGPLLVAFSNYFHQEPFSEPGLLRAVNDEYFERVESMEFTLNHDDGRNIQ